MTYITLVVSKNSIFEISGRVILVCFYFIMLRGSVASLLHNHDPGVLPYIVLQSLVIGFALVRHAPQRLSYSPLNWLLAILPTIMPFFLLPTATAANLSGKLLEYAGAFLLIASVAGLNTSLGIITADRGIKTSGVYRFIRHPSFLGYIIANTGILLSNYSLHNLLFVAGGSVVQIARLLQEEKFLAPNPAYQEYQQQTRWRLLPFIW